MKKKNLKKKKNQNNFSKLSVFQNQKYKFKKKCPLSGKGAPMIDYKNVKLLRICIREWKNFTLELHLLVKKTEGAIFIN